MTLKPPPPRTPNNSQECEVTQEGRAGGCVIMGKDQQTEPTGSALINDTQTTRSTVNTTQGAASQKLNVAKTSAYSTLNDIFHIQHFTDEKTV